MSLRDWAKEVLPEGVQRVARPVDEAARQAASEVALGLDPLRWRNHRALGRFRGIHAGERCFIMGNGPSLNRMDLSPLEREVTFGLNRIYLLFDRMGFSTTYHVVSNRLVLEQFGEEILALPMQKFIRWPHRDLLPQRDDIHYLLKRNRPGFAEDIRWGAWGGATVTYLAMQLAYFMGFDRVILVGVDHNFKTEGPGHREVVSQGPDPNHFAPNYFGKGVRWQLPDLDTSEAAYAMARRGFEADGRSIVDATVGGKLEVFPKVRYEAVVRSAGSELS